jgi:hypothetical protein
MEMGGMSCLQVIPAHSQIGLHFLISIQIPLAQVMEFTLTT